MARLWGLCGSSWKVGARMTRLWAVFLERVGRVEIAWRDCGFCVKRVTWFEVAW